jgi:hypothetical protein
MLELKRFDIMTLLSEQPLSSLGTQSGSGFSSPGVKPFLSLENLNYLDDAMIL